MIQLPDMGISILFVEDDKDDEEFIQEMLEQLTFSNFTFCKDVKSAFEHLATLPKDQLPDLLVSDFQLPSLNGLYLAKALKDDVHFKQIDMAVFSGSLTPATKIKLQRAGITEIFQKPTSAEELRAVLIRLIELATEKHKQLMTK